MLRDSVLFWNPKNLDYSNYKNEARKGRLDKLWAKGTASSEARASAELSRCCALSGVPSTQILDGTQQLFHGNCRNHPPEPMKFLLIFLLAVTVSGKSLDLSEVDVDDLPSKGQRPVFPGAPSTKTEPSNATKGTDDSSSCVDKDDCGSLVRGGFCNMKKIPERIKKYHCPKSCKLCD
ncbi:unnamed protein product [Haemonchus placei]|uniref:ShKT domain-containing protein n=1 Tax=Haemonchus placei TaxID=6290 RepID=A0A0N4WYZ3_HAEPC|nr:unnamed protein product [Haemonchus placei]